MSTKSLLDLFNIENRQVKINNIVEYEMFGDNLLLHTLKNQVIQKLINMASFSEKEINKIINEYKLTELEKCYIYSVIDNELNGFGPLTELLNYKNINEVMVNSKNDIYAEIDGKIIKQENISFISDEHMLKFIERLLKSVHKNINCDNPIISVRLKEGYKLSAIMPPLSTNGPILTIKKSIDSINDIEDMLRMGTLTPYMARFLEGAILSKLNILICGNSGSGKTSLLNVLADLISNDERIVTVEESKELKLKSSHVISLEVNKDYIDNISVKDLVNNALNMRPDRLIVGEIKGDEAFSVIQALNIGLEGVMTTMYANSPEDALKRLEAYILSDGKEISKQVIIEYIVNTIDLVVHIERLSDGRRKVISISELIGINNDKIKLREIFAFSKKGITEKNFVIGEFVLYKYIPNSYKKMKQRGIDNLNDIFEE